MNQIFLAVVGEVGGMVLARHVEKDGAKLTQLFRREFVEKLDGMDARVTMNEVTIESGGQGRPHRHTGPVFGYVLEGEDEHTLTDERVTTYKAGNAFYELSRSSIG